MTPDENYEILVIGSGEAGKYLAWTMAGEGHRVAVVERKYIGGSCPNIACLPRAEASELMAAVQTAMVGRIPYTALHSAIYAHPTMAEGLTFLLRNTPTPAREGA